MLMPMASVAARGDLTPDVAAGKGLLAEGDALADKGETTEAVVRYKKAFEALLPGMRKIPFKHEVKNDVTPREDLRTLLVKEIDEEMTPAEFRADELGMKALGLLPRDFNLKEAMVKVYSEEIAAFYDTKTRTMHLIREPEAKAKKPPTFLERLMGKTGGFDKDENKTVIAHELTHALADQNFDIDAMQKAVKRNDDRSLALSALIEGEATLTMMAAQMDDWDGSKIRQIPAAQLDRIFSLLIPLMPMFGGAALREAPVILSETMIFPYLRGMVFCARLANDDGWKGLDEAYRRPPQSTEQIIHPEKYKAEADPPMTIDLGALEPGAGWTELGRNVVGEMQIGVLLRYHGGKAAAAGWDGDRYAVFEGPGGRLGLVWISTWDSEADAEEFARGYGRLQAGKAAALLPRGDEADRQPGAVPVLAIDRRGADVAVVEGFSPEATASLLDAAFRARKAEMTDAPSPRPDAGRDKADGKPAGDSR
jgi:hypothetical protein